VYELSKIIAFDKLAMTKDVEECRGR